MDLNLLEETSAICSDSWELLDVRRDLRERCLMRRARRSASVWVDCFITLRLERRGGAWLSSSIFEYLLVIVIGIGMVSFVFGQCGVWCGVCCQCVRSEVQQVQQVQQRGFGNAGHVSSKFHQQKEKN